MNTAKEYIDAIKNRLLGADKEYVLDSLTGAVDRLQKAFPRYGSFIMEFIQNADDAKSTKLLIELFDNGIRISNDGKPFIEDDIKSICRIGRSSKSPKDYIGYLGVGFKSVFLISDSPQIYSGDFRFRFDKTAWDDPFHYPWQLIPIWIETAPSESQGNVNTTFDIPLKDSKMLDVHARSL